ncbi:UNVERIFIED_CONTAM: hypothetical protein HDU68_009927 [Siphonaria sp. JEL0065]|nr:hypothetical protein HDU68_009927 [Siphonaria sp. JEL0065]
MSTTFLCNSYAVEQSSRLTTCASVSVKTSSIKAVTCFPVATCPVPVSCAATAHAGMFANNTCLTFDDVISLPPTPLSVVGTYSKAIINVYKSDDCKGQPVSGGALIVNTCNPSPFVNGTWGTVKKDFANTLYWDQADDSACLTYADEKSNILLGKDGSCTNKVSAYLSNNQGFKTSFYYTDSCKTVGGIIQEFSHGECKEDKSTCTLEGPSSVSVGTASCHVDPFKYDFLGTVQATFGSKPYLVYEDYTSQTCQSGSPTRKAAYLLRTCYNSVDDDYEGSSMWTQADNASLVFTYYSRPGCNGAIQNRKSVTGTCDSYVKYSLYNSNVSLAIGGQFVATGPNKASSGFSVKVAGILLGAVVVAFSFGTHSVN